MPLASRLSASPRCFQMLRMQTLYTQYVSVVGSFSSLSVNWRCVEGALPLPRSVKLKRLRKVGSRRVESSLTLLCLERSGVRQECTDSFHCRQSYWFYGYQVLRSAVTNNFVMSACPWGTTPVPPDEFSWKYLFRIFAWNLSVTSDLKWSKNIGQLKCGDAIINVIGLANGGSMCFLWGTGCNLQNNWRLNISTFACYVYAKWRLDVCEVNARNKAHPE